MTPEEVVARYPQRHRIDPILGLIRQCSKCEEWWTASEEFFVKGGRFGSLGLHSWCKACTSEKSAERRQATRITQEAC